MERITLAVGPAHREYLLFVPASTGPTIAGVPLVIFLHGMGATADWADEETGWSRFASREGFAVAIPQALPPNPDQPPKFLTNPPAWQDGGFDKDEGRRMKDEKKPGSDSGSDSSFILHPSSLRHEDLAFLTAVMDDAAARVGADPNRVLVSGFSNGAAMAFRVAAELAGRVAALAAVAGYCRVPDPRPSRPIPTLHVVGSADPLVPLRGGEVRNPWQHRYVRRPPVVETLETWARGIGCDPVPVSDSSSAGSGSLQVDTYPGPVEFRAVVIEGLGHHWPGGRGRFNHRIAGPPSNAVDGTALVWGFFQRQLKRGG